MRPILYRWCPKFSGKLAPVRKLNLQYLNTYCNRLIRFLEHHNLLCKDKRGLSSGKITANATEDLVSKAITALDEKYKTVGVSLDLQKAFDSLGHGIYFLKDQITKEFVDYHYNEHGIHRIKTYSR